MFGEGGKSMFSNDSARQADACRFCWMCRHICPVAGSTGSEAWNPRSRGLMVSMIERGTEYNSEIAETMYHCTMCDACSNDCVTGFKPTDFIREARMLAVVNDIAPKAIMKEIENILEKDNIFGAAVNEKFALEAEKHSGNADVMLFVGQAGRTVAADTAVNAMQLLDKAGVCYTVLKDEPASGAYLGDLMGFVGDVQNAAVKAASAIKAAGTKKLVVLNPYDAVMFRDQYAKWNLLTDVEIVTISAFVAELIAAGALKPGKAELKASLQEPIKLTRGLDEEKPLKDIIEALGVDHVELFLHGKMSRCVGTAIIDGYAPEVAKAMVKTRLEDAARLGSSKIITASPDDSYIMKKYVTDEFEIVDLFTLLNENC